MIIRKMQEEDIAEAAQLEALIFTDPWSENSFRTDAFNPMNRYLVVRIDGILCGYCGLWGVAGEGQITNVAVHPKYRRRGIGRAMLTELLLEGRQMGLSAFTLEVRLSNTSAQNLYHSLGFQDAGIRKQFYSRPKEDAVIMWLISREMEEN